MADDIGNVNKLIPPRHYSVDLNNDGRSDTLTWSPGPRGGTVDSFLNSSHGQGHFVKAPVDLRVNAGRAYAFTDYQTGARFHAARGLQSFAVNQNCGYYNSMGTIMPMHIDGIAFEIHPVPFNNRNIPDDQAPVQKANGKVLNRAYELDGKKVFRQFNIDQLFWIIKIGDQYERIDLNRIVHNDKSSADDAELRQKPVEPIVLAHIQKLTESETLIQPLLADASRLRKDHFSPTAKRAVVLQLEKIAAQWKVKYAQSNPRVQQITNPILWNGILGAMATLAGLKPSDLTT